MVWMADRAPHRFSEMEITKMVIAWSGADVASKEPLDGTLFEEIRKSVNKNGIGRYNPRKYKEVLPPPMIRVQ